MAFAHFILAIVSLVYCQATLYHIDSPSCDPERLLRCSRITARSFGLTTEADGSVPNEFSKFVDFINREFQLGPNRFISAELCRVGTYVFMQCMGDQIASCMNVEVTMKVLGYDLENAQLYKSRFAANTVACAEIIEGRSQRYRPTCPVDTSAGSVAFPDKSQECCNGYWICGKDETDNGSGNFLWRAVCPNSMAIAKDYSNQCEYYSKYDRRGGSVKSCTKPRSCLNLNPKANPFGILGYQY